MCPPCTDNKKPILQEWGNLLPEGYHAVPEPERGKAAIEHSELLSIPILESCLHYIITVSNRGNEITRIFTKRKEW
jgi:hypothetical protein